MLDDDTLTRYINDAVDDSFMARICSAIARTLGYKYFVYMLRVPREVGEPVYYVLHSYPQEWVDFCENEPPLKEDPVIHYVYGHTVPAYWDEVAEMYPDKAGFFSVAARFKLVHGVTAPIHSINGDIALLSLASDERPALHGSTRVKRKLHWFAHAVHNRLKEIVPDPRQKAAIRHLSETEQRVLAAASLGYSVSHIARHMNCAEEEVNAMIASAAEKLGVASRRKQDVIMKAASLGELSPGNIDMAVEDVRRNLMVGKSSVRH